MTAHFKFALHIGSLITEVDGLLALLSIRCIKARKVYHFQWTLVITRHNCVDVRCALLFTVKYWQSGQISYDMQTATFM